MTTITAHDDTNQSDTVTPMNELLEATEENVIALQMNDRTRAGYQEFYKLLREKTSQYGMVHVYEEATDWTGWTFLTHLTGLIGMKQSNSGAG